MKRLVAFLVLLFLCALYGNEIANRELDFADEEHIKHARNYIFLCDFFGSREEANKYESLIDSGMKMVVLISIKDQTLKVLDFTDMFRVAIDTKVSTGKFKGSTPTGEFTISKKRTSWVSKKYKGTMLYWNCIVPDESIAIHGLRDAYYERKLGTPVSHGCIRISNSAAKEFFTFVPVGTKVLVF